MKVLHVISTGRRRGGEIFAADLVRALAQAGFEQRVAVISSDGVAAVPFDVPSHVFRLTGARVPGLRVRWGTVRALRALVREWRPDVVQAHGGQPHKYMVLASPRGTAPVVYRRIGSASYGNDRGLRRLVHARLMRRADAIVAVAEAVREETLRIFGLPEDLVVTIPNAVDPSRLVPSRSRGATRRSLGIPPGAPVVVSLGALSWEKDPLAHLAVADGIRRVRDDVVHLLVGDGILRGSVVRTIGELGVERVRLLGVRADVPELLAAGDVLLLTSRTEGMPAVVIEAGMLGLPVAGFDIAGVPEVVEHGATGLLAAPGDVEGLTRAVLDLLEDPVARREMGEAARERSGRFDIRSVAGQYVDLYRRLASDRSLSRSGEPA
ncbi:MAG TPA: glycosyltransferase family 4 protein [Actinomycetota bacterium]